MYVYLDIYFFSVFLNSHIHRWRKKPAIITRCWTHGGNGAHFQKVSLRMLSCAGVALGFSTQKVTDILVCRTKERAFQILLTFTRPLTTWSGHCCGHDGQKVTQNPKIDVWKFWGEKGFSDVVRWFHFEALCLKPLRSLQHISADTDELYVNVICSRMWLYGPVLNMFTRVQLCV